MTDGRTDGRTDGQTDGQTDGRTDGGDCNIPDAFLKKRGDNKVKLIAQSCQDILALSKFLQTREDRLKVKMP